MVASLVWLAAIMTHRKRDVLGLITAAASVASFAAAGDWWVYVVLKWSMVAVSLYWLAILLLGIPPKKPVKVKHLCPGVPGETGCPWAESKGPVVLYKDGLCFPCWRKANPLPSRRKAAAKAALAGRMTFGQNADDVPTASPVVGMVGPW